MTKNTRNFTALPMSFFLQRIRANKSSQILKIWHREGHPCESCGWLSNLGSNGITWIANDVVLALRETGLNKLT
jgi:hypothetical protein